MKTKHTAGEWRYDSKHAAICEGEAYSHFCNTLIANINPNLGDESQANAVLIAAAPEMLEMLQEVVKHFWASEKALNRIGLKERYPDHYIFDVEKVINKAIAV